MAHYPAAGRQEAQALLATIVSEAVGARLRRNAFGVALEMVHNFTLVHDDVMDEDDTRRGIPTVHAEYGIPEAILAGDALFARALNSFSNRMWTAVTSSSSWRYSQKLFGFLLKAAAGHVFRTCKDCQVWRLHEMIERKTAVLYSAAAEAGAIVAEARRTSRRQCSSTAVSSGSGSRYGRCPRPDFGCETFGKPVLKTSGTGRRR